MSSMDSITKEKLALESERHPYRAIYLERQFLDPTAAGFVPNNWNGETARFDQSGTLVTIEEAA